MFNSHILYYSFVAGYLVMYSQIFDDNYFIKDYYK